MSIRRFSAAASASARSGDSDNDRPDIPDLDVYETRSTGGRSEGGRSEGGRSMRSFRSEGGKSEGGSRRKFSEFNSNRSDAQSETGSENAAAKWTRSDSLSRPAGAGEGGGEERVAFAVAGVSAETAAMNEAVRKRNKKRIRMNRGGSAGRDRAASTLGDLDLGAFGTFLDSKAYSSGAMAPSPSGLDSPVGRSISAAMVRCTSNMSNRTDLVSEASAGDEIFAEFKNEADDVMKRFVNECHHNWRRATAQFGNKALQVFASNDRIQKEIGLSAVQTRQILLGTERIADKWGSVERQIRHQAIKILETCLVTIFEPNASYKPLEVINSNTFVDRKELVFIRVWKSRREGRAYQHALKSMAQTRQDICLSTSVAVPYSVGLVLQTRFVTVTWLVPLIYPVAHPIPAGSIIEQIEQVWKAALGLPPSTEKDSEPIPLYVGGDGRYYAMSLCVLTNSLTNSVAETTRHERFEYNSRDDQVEVVRTGLTASPDAHTKNGVVDRLLPALAKRMKDLKSLLNSPDDFISVLFHCCGVNMQSLLYVREEVTMRLHEADVQFTPLAQRGDFDKAKRFVIQSIECEVAARGLKSLILGKIAEALRGVTTGMPKEELEQNILLCANSVVTGFFRSSKFIRNYLLPVIARKFTNAPEFEIDMATMQFVKVMRHLEDRLGLRFDKTKKEFDLVKSQANVISTSGRRQIPYCPLNDAAAIGFEFLTAQKGLKKDADMTRRALTTLLSLNVAASGINLSIEGSFAVFTESMCDALIKHGQLMEKDLQNRGLHQATRRSSSLITNASTVPSPLSAPRTERVAQHLLLTGILGEFVQKESPAITLSEFDLLYRIPEIIVMDKMYVAERCHVLYDTFVGYTDDEVRQIAPLILNLWGRAISRGLDNIETANRPEGGGFAGAFDSDRNFMQEATRQHALPTTVNMERFLQLTTDEGVAQRVNALPPDGRNDLIRGLIVSSIVVDKRTVDRAALLITSFCDGIHNNSNTQMLHPAMVEALTTIHDTLPASSPLAFVIAILLAPTIMNHPLAMTLTNFAASEIQRIKQQQRMLLPGPKEVYPFLCLGGRLLRQFQLNVEAGAKLYDAYMEERERTLRAKEAKRRTPWDGQSSDHGSAASSRRLLPSDDDGDDLDDPGILDDDDPTESEFDRVSSVATQVVPPKHIGHAIAARMLQRFLLNPEAIERLQFRILEELYEQQHMILQEYCWRTIIHDEWERLRLRYACHMSRDALCRQLFIGHLELAEWFRRNVALRLMELKRRLVLLNAHQRGILMDERSNYLQEVELEMLHTICRQKIKERIERQERDARHRRETKYLTSAVEFTEDCMRELQAEQEHESITVIFERAFIEGALQLDGEWRQREQRAWLLQHLATKEFEQRQKLSTVGFLYPIVLAEWAFRKDYSMFLLRQAFETAEACGRSLLQSTQAQSELGLVEASLRLRVQQETAAALRHFILPKALQLRLRFHNQQCSDVELDESLAVHDIRCHFECERLFLEAAEFKQREVVLLEDHDRGLQLNLQFGILKGNEATHFLSRIETTERKSRRLLIDLAAQETWYSQESFLRGRLLAQESVTSQAHHRTYAKIKTSFFAYLRERLEEAQAVGRDSLARQSLYTPQAFLNQLSVLAITGVDDIRKKERRHYAALISALNIEEGSEGPRHDEQRLTTQARRRVLDVEYVIRRKFAMEERRGRMQLDELHGRIYVLEEQEAERMEWWALLVATRQYVVGGGTAGSGMAGGDRSLTGSVMEYAVFPLGASASAVGSGMPSATLMMSSDYASGLQRGGAGPYPFHRSKLDAIMAPSSPDGQGIYSLSADELLRLNQSGISRAGPFATGAGSRNTRAGSSSGGGAVVPYYGNPRRGSLSAAFASSPYPPPGSPVAGVSPRAGSSRAAEQLPSSRMTAMTPEIGALFPSISRRRGQDGPQPPQQQQNSPPPPVMPSAATSRAMVPTPPRQAATTPRNW